MLDVLRCEGKTLAVSVEYLELLAGIRGSADRDDYG